MRNIVIVLLVVGVIVLAFGVANHDGHADIDYAFGTWVLVPLPALFAIIAGVIVVVGLVVAAIGAAASRRSRRALEADLQQTYDRLREAEAAAETGAAAPPASVGTATERDVPAAAPTESSVGDMASSGRPPVAGAAATDTAPSDAPQTAGAAAADTPGSSDDS